MRSRGLLALALTAFILPQSLEGFSEGRMAIPVIVELDDLVGLRYELLRDATAEADDTFRAAGVQLLWSRPGHDSGEATASCARIVRLTIQEGPPPVTAGETRRDEALGSAAPWSGRARIFYRRITSAAAEHPIAPSRIFGHVISHELGHLLLESTRHTDVGIMRPSVDFHHIAMRRFTEEEARLIRSGLTSGSQETTSCGR